jgi:beta-galactosidase
LLEKYNFPYNKVYSTEIMGNVITVKASLSTVSKIKFLDYTTTYTFHGNGQIDVIFEGDFDTARTFLPRLGLEFKTQATDFSYFGYGPYESYVDTHYASKMGLYESSASNEYVDYIKPQEHGNHYNTKMLSIGGYKFVSEKGFEFNVSEYSTDALSNKAHNFELEKDKYTDVRIDCKVSGIGSGSCGPQLDPKYQANGPHFSFAFSITK